MVEAHEIESERWHGRFRLDAQSSAPLYRQLREQLRSAASEFESHSLMPSEKELMSWLGVSRPTARKAISDLVHEGVLYARQGRGTFTAAPRVEASLERPAGFSETMRRLGRTPSSEVLGLERTTASPRVSAALRLQTEDEVFVVDRLRLLDGEPCMHERAYVPVQLAP
jgi:GntR family transcriptional regulator